ncbi:4Fe-4S dicluster domain-containing protein [Geothrix alkalitolerans]|uniref:4Fe-4S dicluster domain-containing protein n=1 Tax=Geothrix alkalitolerans TaxID=2922724 RepID=UPI001FB03FAE|nr:4Fe-4S dicluster domain-containing protein [Geothrix alkalitolerans]
MTDPKPTMPPESWGGSSCGTRREFLGVATAAMAAALTGCGTLSKEEFLQRNFRELSKQEVLDVIARLEKEYKAKYGKDVKVANTPAIPGVIFGYALDLSRCIGCRRCVHACVKENNQSRDPEVQWIRVLQMDKEEGVNLQHADQYYNPEEVPQEGHFYMPVQCQQCKKPPCTKVCPVGATWREKDGIVVVDYNWCIGCRYCMAACPYGARHFNWGEPNLPADQVNTNTHYLGNRPRPKGVVEKCTFCIQRTRNGQYPACVEICPTGSRKFGNLLDKDSEIRYVLENKRVFKFKEDLNTQPNFFYFYGV